MNWLGRTLTRKFTFLLAGFLALQVLQLGIGIFGVLHVGEESAAINEAGRQRMRTYHLLYLAHEAMEFHSWPSEGRKIVDGVLADYDAESVRLNALAGKSAKYKRLREAIVAVRAHWDGELKPLLLAFDPSNPQAALAIMARFEAQVPGHVRHLDEVVNLLEQDAAEDTRELAIFQAVILGLTLLLGAAGFVMARYVVSLPLRRLIEATQSIATGAYDRQVTVSSHDEIGELAGTFNRMAEAVRERNSHILGLKKYAEDILASLPAGLVVLDDALRVHSVNRSFRELFGRKNGEDLSGRDLEDILPVPDLREQARGVLASGVALHGVDAMLNGKHFLITLTGIRLAEEEEEEEEERRLLVVVEDVSARKHAEERLSHLAYYDTLTDLPNRVLLLERLQQALVDAERVNRLVAVMFLDLDRFKVINDTLGHHVGDALLKAVAERLKSCLRPGDIIARLGGDEFTVVLANVAHVDDVARVARKILEGFAAPFRVEDHELFTTTSIGITLFPLDVQEPESLLKNADAAMYHAKESGRNAFQFFTAELNVRAERRLRLETALRQALGENQLSLHYQPQVDLKSGRIVGMEALARWNHPELGAVSPAEFIPIAEETGLILPIGEWVLREACRQIKAWHATGFPKLQVAVNVSGKQLRQKNFADRVRDILLETNLEPRYLDLELTESLLMKDVEETGDILHVLHDLGASFSVDDFGTGYSSLAYLKRFPIDILKIDQSFVRDLATDPNDAAIVKTIIAMAHMLDMRVIAEGVETYEQLEFLRAQGCDGTQGYYCSKPLTADDFTELLADWKRLSLGKCRLAKPRRRPVRARTTRGPAAPRKGVD